MPGKLKNTKSDAAELTELFRSSARAASDRNVGIEIERIGLWTDGTALHYTPQAVSAHDIRPGAGILLREMKDRYRWKPVTSPHGELLGFSSPFGKVSLEPGSQLELSTEIRPDIRIIIKDVQDFETAVEKISQPWGLHWVGIGMNPFHRPQQIDVIPSPRYHIMTDYLGSRGRLGTSMMRLTSSIQINLDYQDEAEGLEMLQAALAAAPLSYALFSNSPWKQGEAAGVLSYRNTIWRDTDPDRVGLLPEAFTPGFDFSDYAALVWNRPLMFAQTTDGSYVPAHGKSLADISLGALAGVVPDPQNQMNAVREMFIEARLKPGYVEVRSIDGQAPEFRYATVAFWTGILYHPPARQFILETLGKLTAEQRRALWVASARDGLKAEFRKGDLRPLVAELITLAREGLKNRNLNEESLLEPVEQILKIGLNPAQQLLRSWNEDWNRDFAKVIQHVSGSRP
jgi:glutamate--cysteine ligase